MSISKKRTIGEIYNGNDLSEVVLKLPLTPFSEQFILYKLKLDKAISDLILLIKEQINKDEYQNLDSTLEKIRNSMNEMNEMNGSDLTMLKTEIKQDKYYSIYLDIIQLEKSKSNIMECFIKWKNDHYYTRWEELNQPPHELRELWIEFKEKISNIITNCKKINSRPLPRLVMSENINTEESNNIELNEEFEERKLDQGLDSKNNFKGEFEEKNLEIKLDDNKLHDSIDDSIKEQDEKKFRDKTSKKIKGSYGFWGPKTVAKSKNRYISGISTIRSIKKRIFNSNGRYKNIRDKDIPDMIQSIENRNKKNNKDYINDDMGSVINDNIEIRNLMKWERIKERRYDLKRKKYLMEFKDNNGNRTNFENNMNDVLNWSNNFSQGCKNMFKNESQASEDNNLSTSNLNEDLFEKIRLEIQFLNNLESKDFTKLNELCTEFLKEYFNYEKFREGQLEAIHSIFLSENCFSDENNKKRMGSILILPTGYGKSLCFQFVSLLINKWYRKVTIVITPLISLMQDQLRCLNNNIKGALWNSNTPLEERKIIMKLIKDGNLDILFVTPESIFSSYLSRGLLNDNNLDKNDLSKNYVGFLCIDEAHCVCEWGHSFRPSYYSSINLLINRYKVDRVLGMTATAPNNVLDELKNLLRVERVIRAPLQGKIQRENLKCKVLYLDKLRKKNDYLIKEKKTSINKVPKLYNNYTVVWDHIKYSIISNRDIVRSNDNVENKNLENNTVIKPTRREIWSKCKNILIYVWQRSEVESVTNYLRTKGANALYYHGMMSINERELVQKSFMKNMTNIFVATTSFGMGIDKKDIDAVIHWNMPNSLEQYIQETGRCAREMDRDGYCLLILSDEDYKLKRQIISSSMVDRCSLRCLLYIILNSLLDEERNNKIKNSLDDDISIDYDIYSIELFKKILNIRQNEEVEVILHFIKPYLDFALNKIYDNNDYHFEWKYYNKGSPFVKIRCFDQDFDSIKKKDSFFMDLSSYCTENSGVITINIPEASKGMKRTIEYIEEEIESRRNTFKISIEKQVNKQCIIATRIGYLKNKDFNQEYQDKFQKLSVLLLYENQELTRNWIDNIVENLYNELLKKNMSEIWKLDIAFISFQCFDKNKTKETILDFYFNGKKKELYKELIDSEIFGISNFSVDELLDSVNTNIDEKFDELVNEMWFHKWNDELKQNIFQDTDSMNESLKKEIFQKTETCIRSSINFLLSSHLNNYSPVQWETYRISVESITNYFNKTLKENNKLFKQYSLFDEFEVLFPSDIARILVGTNSYRFYYKGSSNCFRKELNNEVFTSKLWGRFKNIPYRTVLKVCEERFKEIALEKFI